MFVEWEVFSMRQSEAAWRDRLLTSTEMGKATVRSLRIIIQQADVMSRLAKPTVSAESEQQKD